MSILNAEQILALKTALLAEPEVQIYITNGDDTGVANWLNTTTTFIVWKTYLSEEEIIQNDTFNFTLVDGLTAGKRDEWSNFLFKTGSCNPSKGNIRAGFLDVWSGTAAKTAVYNGIIAISKRFATNAEKILALGAGTDAVPGLLSFEGNISGNAVSTILRG